MRTTWISAQEDIVTDAPHTRQRPRNTDTPMAQARTRTQRLTDHVPEEVDLPAMDVDVGEITDGVKIEDGILTVENPDGGVTINFSPDLSGTNKDGDFYENLAHKIGEVELSRISEQLLSAIDQDDQSRKEWLETRRRGIELLGLKLEEPKGDVSDGTVSSVRHPVLLEAVLRFQANARAELLPSSGPVKVRNDTPPRPENPTPAQGTQPGGQPGAQPGMPPMPGMPPGIPMPGMGGPQMAPFRQMMEPLLGPQYQEVEDLSEALEIDLNHYLTVTAREYYPDTDRMLFQVGFGGLGIKKVYNCPLRRRPVSESIDAQDLIVSNATTDLANAGRITHVIKMRPSVLKRMQIVGAYRDVELSLAPLAPLNPVDQAVTEMQGINPPMSSFNNNEDIEQLIYESYCELDIVGYEHKDGEKVTGLRCPYKVTIHKESRKILEVRRNWEEDDELCIAREFFVDFPFVRSFGFYPVGLLHILGNAATALTAAWRMTLDAGMFASFPGFLYASGAGRQLTNEFRVSPGGGLPIQSGSMPLKDAVMPLPYRDVSAAFMTFIEQVQTLTQRVGGTAEATVGEGKQDVPVGTTLAMIEQATKLMDAVHKRLHSAQDREFKLLKERFKEDPEAFWRQNKKPAVKWKVEQFLKALDQSEIVPVADPNNPTSLHRIAKATAIKTLEQANPSLYDPMAVDKRIFRVVGIDPEGLFRAQPAPPPPDPRIEAIKSKERTAQMQNQTQAAQAQTKAQESMFKVQGDEKERQSKERMAQQQHAMDEQRLQQEHSMEMEKMKQQLQLEREKAMLELQTEKQKMMMEMQQFRMEMGMEQAKGQQEMAMEQRRMGMESQMQERQMAVDSEKQDRQMQFDEHSQRQSMDMEREKNESKMGMEREKHQMSLEQQRESGQEKLKQSNEMNKAKIDTTKAIAKAKGGEVKK